jgi:hypothetical protein
MIANTRRIMRFIEFFHSDDPPRAGAGEMPVGWY